MLGFRHINSNCFPLICFLIFSYHHCNAQNIAKKNSDSEGLVTIDVNDQLNPCESILQMFSVEKLLPLETSEHSYFKSLNTLKIRNDTIFLFPGNTVLLFDIKGRYLASVGKKGRGPGEINIPSDFTLPRGNGDIIILDNSRRTLMYFTPDGEIRTRKYPGVSYINRAQWVDDNYFLLFSYMPQPNKDTSYSVYGFNASSGEAKGLLPFPSMRMSTAISDYNFVSEFNHQVYIRLPLVDTIYLRNTSNALVPKYVINFKTGNKPKKYPGEFKTPMELRSFLIKNKICMVSQFLELQDHFYLIYEQGKDRFIHLISKVDGSQSRYIINSSGELFSTSAPTIAYNQYIIGVIDPIVLKRRYDSSSSWKNGVNLNVQWENDIDKLSDEDNTVLIYYKIKK